MAVTSLMHFLQESGICRNQKSHKQFKYSITRDKLHLSIDHVSSPTSDHNLLTQNLSDCIKRPICSIRYRYNMLKCRSSLLPDSNITAPCIKTATTTMTGPNPYTSLHGSLCIPKLVMAVGVVVFALWGLEPLVRTTRNVSLHKDDNSWKRCTTNYILRSYLQPLLLWAGTMLVCRTLDPVVMPTEASRLIKQRAIAFVRSLSSVLALAYCLSCAVQQAHKVFVETTERSDAGSMGFHLAGKAVYTSVWIAAASLFMELLGFSTKKWLTAGGLGTVLLTLAGREIFTNFLSSAIIQATRPFVVNEWIQADIQGYEVSGTVEDVRWWSPTLIRGEDREAVYIPNHKFTMNVVRNLSQKTHWRVRASLAISLLDVNKINIIVADMRKVLAKNPQVEQQKLHRRVFFDSVNPINQALTILVSCFVKTPHHEEYLCVKEAILLDLLRVVKHHRARLATPIRTIQNHCSDPDTDNIPFSEPVDCREETPNRLLLLIDPSYEIHGEELAKPHADSQADAKLKGTSTSESKVGEASKCGTKAGSSSVDAQEEENSGLATSAFAVKEEVKQPVKSLTSASKSTEGNKVKELGKKSGSGDAQQSVKVGSNRSSSACSRSKHIEKPFPAQPRPALEENIVLEVALDGSKRVLPLEPKEVASNRNSNDKGDVTPAIKKADKDD